MPPDQHRSSLCDDVACRAGDWDDVQWNPDGATSPSSPPRATTSTNSCASPTWQPARSARSSKRKSTRSSNRATARVNWRYLPKSNEVLWFSERDNWGHLYLYDSTTGKLKNRITTGEGNVTQLLRVDEDTRTLYFLGVGLEKGRDPYFQHLYRIGMDGRNLDLLTPEDANHDVTLSPSGKYFVDSYSKPDAPPVAVTRDNTGKLVATLERADISKLLAAGWKPPVPFTVKARDGATDLYGLMYQPTHLDPNRKYPIINHIYPGPQTGQCGRPQLLGRARRLPGDRGTRASSSSRSTAWARRGARRNSTRRTSATWATTRSRTRSPA